MVSKKNKKAVSRGKNESVITLKGEITRKDALIPVKGIKMDNED